MAGRDGGAAARRGSHEQLLPAGEAAAAEAAAPAAAAVQQPPPTRPDRQPPPRRAADTNVQREQASQRARWRAPQAPDDDALGDNSPCRWLCRQLGRVVLGALGVILVIFWLLLGQLLSLQTLAPPALLSVLGWAGVGGLYVQLLSITPCGLREALHRELSHGYVGFDESLLDAMVFFTVAALLAALSGKWAASSTIMRPRRCAWLPALAAVLLHTGVVVAKVLALRQHAASAAGNANASATRALTEATIVNGEESEESEDSSAGSGSKGGAPPLEESCHVDFGRAEILLSAAHVCVVLTAVWCSRVWAQATPERLKAAECKVVEERVNGRAFRQRVVAGIGTLEAGPAEAAGAAAAAAGNGTPLVDDSVPAAASALPQQQTPPVIVLIHGLGAGNGLWCENIRALSDRHRLLCIEWRGCGRSDRPSFTAKTYAETVEWFIPAFARWFEAMGLQQQAGGVTLVGHSMGAMLATEWARLHPHTVRRLVLASPAGVPEKPPGRGGWSNNSDLPLRWRLLRWLWVHHVTPFTVIRLLGPLARPAVRRLLLWRVGRVPETSRSRLALEEPFSTILTEYMLQNLTLRGSGENAMVTMLQPGAYAPTGESLEQKLLELGGRGSSSTTCTPISFIYGGTKDWMTSAHGARVVDTLRQRADADAASGGGGGDPHQQRDPQHTIVVLETSGHHVMLDDAVGFNEAVLAAADL